MKRTLALGCVAAVFLSVACSKKPEATGTPDVAKNPAADATAAPATDATAGAPANTTVAGSGGLTLQQIAEALSKSVCERMDACKQSAGLTVADCTAGMTADLAQALPEKAGQTNKAQLDTCIGAIGKATCEELNSPNPPKGCEFIE